MDYRLKLFGSVLAISLLAGCSSKQDVVVDSGSQPKKVENVDQKLDDIKTNGITEEKIVESSDAMKSDTIEESKDYNEVSSVIDGQEVIMRSVHFGFDIYTLNVENQKVSNDNAKKIEEIAKVNNNVKVKLEGNCDEWGTDEYNYALGLKRATTVKKDLIRNGIDANSIVTVSYGESNPVCTDKTAQCWKKNRRVDYKLLP